MSTVTAVAETAIGPVRLAATDAGLCKIALGEETPEAFAAWLARWVGPAALAPQAALLQRTVEQLNAYLAGRLRDFDLPLDLRGTPFQRAVWQAVAGVPYGQTATYGQIAAQIGSPGAARAVGAANGANPLPVVIPCHRILGSDGALRGYGGGLHVKQYLLSLEQAG